MEGREEKGYWGKRIHCAVDIFRTMVTVELLEFVPFIAELLHDEVLKEKF